MTIGLAKLKNIFYEFNKKGILKSVVLEVDAEFNEDMEEILYYHSGNFHDQYFGTLDSIRVWNIENSLIVFRENRSKDFTVTFRSKLFDHTENIMNKDISDF